MPPAELPSWVQEVSIFAVACVSIVVAVFKYVKTETTKTVKKPEPQEVVAATFIDSRVLKELIDALREHAEESSRTAQRITRSSSELRETVIENTEAQRLQTDAMLNMLRFANRKHQLEN